MTRRLLRIAFLSWLAMAACTPAKPPAVDAPPGGTWSGSYGVDGNYGHHVETELRWEGSVLTGTIRFGKRRMPLVFVSFEPATGRIRKEFDLWTNGRTVRYTSEGTVQGNTMSGQWTSGGLRGTYRLIRE